MGQKKQFGVAAGLILIFSMAVIIAQLDSALGAWFQSRGIGKNPLEYPLIAVVLGLIVNGILRVTKTRRFVMPAVRTELFLKIGLVLLGARISIGDIMSKGAGGLVQAIIMVTSVFFFTWWLGERMNVDKKLRAVMCTAVSICGVSAAIAAAGAVLAKKKEITYVTTLVIATALPLMIIMPWIAQVIGLPEAVAGAWFGGNIDTTAAVVGAGTIHGEIAQGVATVVKMSQNVLIGFAVFLLALYFVMVVERKPEERPSPAIIWHRFPKFVLGFLFVSILASVGLFSAEQVSVIKILIKWAFAMAFFCIGIEVSIKDIGSLGWRPLAVFTGATVFNTLLALGVSWLIFGMLQM
jgi:uncharacterized integral membrane protein (TIGR00698 family)